MDVIQIPLQLIQPDPEQVRKTFNKEAIVGLAQSVAEVGMLQPVLVKEIDNGRYRLIAGERRYRAAQELNLESISAIVLHPGINTTQVQLIENLQREDLNPVERALALQAFMQMENLCKKAAAERLGVPRTTLTDWLDVLKVPERFQRALVDNHNGGDSPVTLSHINEARALANKLNSPAMCEVVLDAVILYKLSKVETREVCALVRQNANVSIDVAVKAVRRPAEVSKLPKAEEDARMAAERNIAQWVSTLERCQNTLTELNRVAPQYLSPEDRERLRNHLQELQQLAVEALARISAAVPVPNQMAS